MHYCHRNRTRNYTNIDLKSESTNLKFTHNICWITYVYYVILCTKTKKKPRCRYINRKFQNIFYRNQNVFSRKNETEPIWNWWQLKAILAIFDERASFLKTRFYIEVLCEKTCDILTWEKINWRQSCWDGDQTMKCLMIDALCVGRRV